MGNREGYKETSWPGTRHGGRDSSKEPLRPQGVFPFPANPYLFYEPPTLSRVWDGVNYDLTGYSPGYTCSQLNKTAHEYTDSISVRKTTRPPPCGAFPRPTFDNGRSARGYCNDSAASHDLACQANRVVFQPAPVLPGKQKRPAWRLAYEVNQALGVFTRYTPIPSVMIMWQYANIGLARRLIKEGVY